MFCFYNANPRGRHVNDCTVRAISKATNRSWDEIYRELSHYAQLLCIMPDDVTYIDEYLETHFEKIYLCKKCRLTIREFVEHNPLGTFLITMNGHITCVIDGVIYDTFDPSNRFIWGVYKVKEGVS